MQNNINKSVSATDKDILLKMVDIEKTFPGVKALDHAQLTVKKGTVHALMGENGAGKSTLMKCLFGVYSKDNGHIYVEGEEVDYKNSKEALENGTSVAWANDNTEVIAFAVQNEGYTVGIPSLGSADTIAPAVSKGNTTLLDWINDEIVALGEENFFHADYEATLADTYGLDYEDSLVVEGGKVNAQ